MSAIFRFKMDFGRAASRALPVGFIGAEMLAVLKEDDFCHGVTAPSPMCHPERTGPQTFFSLGVVSEGFAFALPLAAP